MKRRQFVKVAVAAVGTPQVVSSRVLGLEGATAANERITLGLVGAGGQGSRVADIAVDVGCRLLAVCDVRKDRRERYACARYNDFRELLARDDIDAVIIATPDHWHAIQMIQAAKAGKDVYGEKPLSLTIAEAGAVVRAVRRYGCVFQTGSQQRSTSIFRFACEMVQSGRIGQLKSVHVNVGDPSTDAYYPQEPVPEGLDWDVWLGPARWRPFNRALLNFRLHRDYSGGGTTDWGAHHFDTVQWALDADDTGPVQIIPPDGRDVLQLTFQYAGGVPVYHGGADQYGRGGGILFTGSEGRIGLGRNNLWTEPASLMRKPIGPDEVRLYRSPANMAPLFADSRGPYDCNRVGHVRDWLASIRNRQDPAAPVEVGCRSVTVCHLGNLAYWLGRPLRWDPLHQRFVGDDEANRWLDRPKRAPWTL